MNCKNCGQPVSKKHLAGCLNNGMLVNRARKGFTPERNATKLPIPDPSPATTAGKRHS